MMINLKDNSEKDKYILELFQTSPKEAFRLLFDAYHMKLCIYAVQLTDSFGSPDKPGGLSIQLCKSEKKEFYIRYSS